MIGKELKNTSPSSFRHYQVQGRNGELKGFWAFTKVVRLKKYGKKRLVIAQYCSVKGKHELMRG